MVNLLQKVCDLQYLLDGAFLEAGLQRHKQPALAEIHRANMSKIGSTWPKS